MRDRLIIIMVVVIVGLSALYLFFMRDGYLWYATREPFKSEPFDFGLYHEMVDTYTGGNLELKSGEFEDWDLEDYENNTGTIVVRRNTELNFVDSVHYFTLDSLARRGHHIVIMRPGSSIDLYHFVKGDPWKNPYPEMADTSYFLPVLEVDSITPTVYEDYVDGITSEFNPTDSRATFNAAYQNDTTKAIKTAFRIGYKDRTQVQTHYDDVEIIMSNPERPDQVYGFAVPRGQGKVIVVMNDHHFLNYCLSNPANYPYTRDFIQSLPSDFYWIDNYYTPFGGQRSNNTGAASESPISFLLSNPPLRWAYYLLIASTFMFLLLRARRRQRVIPVLETPKNQSLEFAKSLGVLQSKSENSHVELCLEIKRQFRNWARSRFRKNIEIDNDFRNHLIQMLPEQEVYIKNLFFLFERAESNPEAFTAENLNKVYSVTRYIYHHV